MSQANQYKTCPGCQAEVELRAATCPYCSTKQFRRGEVLVQRGLSAILPEKFPATKFLLFINVAFFVCLTLDVTLHPDFSFSEALLSPPGELVYRWGAHLRGELTWWRLITANFIHIGILHICMNMVALRYIGPLVERKFGSAMTILSFVVLGTASMFASNISGEVGIVAGASGALMAWVGMVGMAAWLEKTESSMRVFKSMLFIVVATIAFGICVNGSMGHGIDNIAHIAGIVFGVVAGAVLPKQQMTGYIGLWPVRISMTLATVAMCLTVSSFVFVALASESDKYQTECIRDLKLKQYDRALNECRLAYEADNSQVISYHNYIFANAMKNDYKEAQRLCDEADKRFEKQRQKEGKLSFDALCYQVRH